MTDQPSRDDSPAKAIAARSRWPRIFLAQGAVGIPLITLIHWVQPDPLAAVTAIPPWCWWLLFTFLVVLALWRDGWKSLALASLVLCACGFVSVEQFRSGLRVIPDSLDGRADQPWLRVVTVNCSAGSAKVAAEVVPLRPDVVLLQESPSADALQRLAHELYGDRATVLWSSDCSIIAAGKLEPISTGERHFVQARLRRGDGTTVLIVCLRLEPPVVRYDLWAQSCWRAHEESRRTRRAQALFIGQSLPADATEIPIVLGGDCNAPAGDGALTVWSPKLRDAFATAGVGWGCTVLNEVPVHRFDQVWANDRLLPRRVFAVRSEHSDHRLTVAEFDLVGPAN